DGVADSLNLYFVDTNNDQLPSGYLARFEAYVDSNNNNSFDWIGGRREAFRAFTSNLAVGLDERMAVTTPTVDLGSLAEGNGYSPLPPGTSGTSTFSPWAPAFGTMTAIGGQVVNPITTTEAAYVNEFKNFTIENEGNANLTNLRLARGVSGGPFPGPWPIHSTSADDLGWLDANAYVFTNFDWTFGLMSEISLQKARVGDAVPTQLSLDPNLRLNQNLGIKQTSLFPNWPVTGLTANGLDYTSPLIAVTPPIGFPVGTYQETMRVIDDVDPFNGNLFQFPYGDQWMQVDGSNNPLEPMSDPGFLLKFTVREDRLTGAPTPGTVSTGNATLDAFQAAPNQQALAYANTEPTALRDLNGNLMLAYTSPQPSFGAPRPTVPDTDPQNQIYIATLAGTAPTNNMASPLAELNGFKRASDNQWLQQQVGPYPGKNAALWNNLFQVQGSDSVLDAKFSDPSFPSSGLIDPLGGPNFSAATMAFLGTAQIQTTGGRINQYRLMTANVSMNASGAVTIGSPAVMPYDSESAKSRPSVYQVQGGAVVFYAATNTGVPQLFYTVTDGTNYTAPQVFSVGDGFEELNTPSVQVRQYVGVGTEPNGGKAPFPILELTFAGKLRGEATSQIYYGRAYTTAATVGANTVPNTPGSPMYLSSRRDTLTKGSETGTYHALGVLWNKDLQFAPGVPEFRLYEQIGSAIPVELEDYAVPANLQRTVDQKTGLISAITKLGLVYIDPMLGTVRFANTVPPSNANILLDYQPQFIQVSDSQVAGHGSPTVLWDNRIAGDVSSFSYWFNVNAGGSVSNVPPNATPRP
ncbi:MAG TPA: hypothetical protein VMI31_12740, partial [Fimbriimonadaceae bacterium]|nr:hypothetical protein [Fimbriimonadaceae bacterium]